MGEGTGTSHPQEGGQGTRKHRGLPCTPPSFLPSNFQDCHTLPTGNKGRYSPILLLWGPEHLPAPGAMSFSGISISAHGCGELQEWARGFQAGVSSDVVSSLKSLLSSNTHICLAGLRVLSRTGTGWEGLR